MPWAAGYRRLFGAMTFKLGLIVRGELRRTLKLTRHCFGT